MAHTSSDGSAKAIIFDFDSDDAVHVKCGNYFARAESMALSNDPRFFASNVIDKRLAAFGKLSIVSGLMVGTSIGQVFALKKDMDLSETLGQVQLIGFLMMTLVVFMCLLALYVIAHQLFYTYRLLTAGPTGFEQAATFYLSRTVTMWRHIAIKSLLNGLWLFIASTGVCLYVKFKKDALDAKPKTIFVLNLANGTSSVNRLKQFTGIDGGPQSHLNLGLHEGIGIVILVVYIGYAGLLCYVRSQHLHAFRHCYAEAKAATQPLLSSVHEMSTHRSRSRFLDT